MLLKMIIKVTFPDSYQETFLSAQDASYYVKVTPGTILKNIKIGKKKIIRKRDKAEFQIEVKDYPRIKIKKEEGGEVFVFSTLREAEEYFYLKPNYISVKISKNIPTIISKKQRCFLTIIEHNLKPFPRLKEEIELAFFQRTSRGPQYLYQGHYKDKLAKVNAESPIDYEILKNNERVRRT